MRVEDTPAKFMLAGMARSSLAGPWFQHGAPRRCRVCQLAVELILRRFQLQISFSTKYPSKSYLCIKRTHTHIIRQGPGSSL